MGLTGPAGRFYLAIDEDRGAASARRDIDSDVVEAVDIGATEVDRGGVSIILENQTQLTGGLVDPDQEATGAISNREVTRNVIVVVALKKGNTRVTRYPRSCRVVASASVIVWL